MFPIIKIRLTYVKRNLIKNLISFGYPIITICMFVILLKYPEKFDLFSSNSNIDGVKPRKTESIVKANPSVYKHPPTYY